jgi:hypothetical protein
MIGEIACGHFCPYCIFFCFLLELGNISLIQGSKILALNWWALFSYYIKVVFAILA